MKTKVITISTCDYKGHKIRKVEDEVGNILVLIDNDSDIVESAPKFMNERDFPYANISDAKRCIDGEAMKYVISDVYDYWDKAYTNRFTNKVSK